MKRMLVFGLLLGLLAVGTLAADEGEWSEWVAAQWKDGSWYLGKVAGQTSDGKYKINYADGDKWVVREDQIIKIPARMNLKVGDKVMAAWSNKRFYPGSVRSVTAAGAVIAWDDGDQPLLVAHGQIMPPLAAE